MREEEATALLLLAPAPELAGVEAEAAAPAVSAKTPAGVDAFGAFAAASRTSAASEKRMPWTKSFIDAGV